MRAAVVAVVTVVAVGMARADAPPDAAALAPMHRIADELAGCAELVSGLDSDSGSGSAGAPCTVVARRTIRGLGDVQLWTATAPFAETRFAVAIRADGQWWMSAPSSVMAGGCGAGHCVDIDVAPPSLREHHAAGRRALASFALAVTRRRYLNQQPHGTDAISDHLEITACGAAADGTLACATYTNDDPACTLNLADDGTVARACRWTGAVQLDPPPP